MYLKDTLSQTKKKVETNSAGKVGIYSCGPTVYDYPHIGNWYAFLRWDLLVRTLNNLGFETLWVMNITDVGHLVSDADTGEDKLAKKAAVERKTAWDIAHFYTDYFLQALKRLNFSQIDHLPKASEHIKEQIALLKKLEALGFTYLIDDGLYYDSAQLKDYGKLDRDGRQGHQAGIRVDFNPQKRNVTDFALWKLIPPDKKADMAWDSPWGRGAPGWHLECSAMAAHYLELPLEIHAGGIDHIPIHHTNEIAQSEPVWQCDLAKIWLHSNFITVDGQKMSKSLGNFYTLEDIEEKGYDLQSFRLAVFCVRYCKLADFNWTAIHNAQKRLRRLQNLAVRIFQLSEDDQHLTEHRQALNKALKNIKNTLSDDLNSPKALECLDDVCQRLSSLILSHNLKADLVAFFAQIDQIFGLSLSRISDLTPRQTQILATRQKARQASDFKHSDQLRQELANDGLAVLDLEQIQIWQYL